MYKSGFKHAYSFFTRSSPILPKIIVDLSRLKPLAMPRPTLLTGRPAPRILHPTLPALLSCLVLPAITTASAPPHPRIDSLIGDWTNGWYYYQSEKVNDHILQFYGHDEHEAGYAFTVGVRDDGSFYILGHQSPESKDDSTADPSFGKRGDKLVPKAIGGNTVLILEYPDGTLKDFMEGVPKGTDLEQIQRGDKIKFELSGKYIDSVTRRKVIFFPNEPKVDGLSTPTDYDFGTSYDALVDVLVFSNEKKYYYDRTDDRLDLYQATGSDDDEYKRGDFIMTLYKTEWFDLSGGDGQKGRYAFASTRILTYDILDILSSRELRMLRNEIYARHGYIFKTPDMKSYFAGESWYQPRFENVDDKLTDIERFNLMLILHRPIRS